MSARSTCRPISPSICRNRRERWTDNVVLTRTDGVLEIRLNRPEKKNALTRAMYDAMADAFAQVDADPTLRVALLTGTGDTFTSGNDIADFQARAASSREGSASRFLPTISSMQKPLIAAVNGAAIGVGTTMLMHCDLIIAARSARFVMPFTSLGLVPEAGKLAAVPSPARPPARQRAAAAGRAAGCRDRASNGASSTGGR